MLKLHEDLNENRRLWQELPEIANFQSIGTLKPAASIYLDFSTQTGLERKPLLVSQPYGRGFSYIFASAGSWRWQMSLPAADLRHETFWRQLLRELVINSPGRFRMTSQVIADHIKLTMEVRNEIYEPERELNLTAVVTPESGELMTVEFQNAQEFPGVMIGEFSADESGLYSIESITRRGDEPIESSRMAIYHNAGMAEYFSMRTNLSLLNQLADATGGRNWSPGFLDELQNAVEFSQAASQLENDMIKHCLILLILQGLPLTQVYAAVQVTIIQGLQGTPEYGEKFRQQTEQVLRAAASVTDEEHIAVLSGEDASRENVLEHMEKLTTSLGESDRIAVYLVGHGSFDGFEYKFNVPGPDITGDDLITVMDKLPAGIQLLVNTSSASGAVFKELENDRRVVITATRSGNERLATRFGSYFFAAFDDPAADINKNNAITAQEAFDYAQRHVDDYFEHEGTLATEHSVISGDLAGQLVLARVGLDTPAPDNPVVADLIQERDQLDRRIEELQLSKSEMEPTEFLNQLQQLMIDLSMVQGRIDEETGANSE
jgi:hypothetical protein